MKQSPKQALPIGLSDFKQLRREGFYYVDKTLLAQEVIECPAQVMLLPRPRRFGKTLNLSMLRYFFEKSEEDNKALFLGTKISNQKSVWELQGTYPVIYLSFKDVKGPNWEYCYQSIYSLLQEEISRLLANVDLTPREKDNINILMAPSAPIPNVAKSLFTLSAILHRIHQQKVILLIDEYDVPIHSGFLEGYYDEAITFIRSFLGAALKDNVHLKKGVISGILRIAKESVFSDLNNVGVYSLLNPQFSPYFGFTQPEVDQILADFQLVSEKENVKEWYNGYQFGKTTIYNPWSITNFVMDQEHTFKTHWINTSDNALIKQLLSRQGTGFQEDLEILLKGEVVEKPIVEHLTLRNLDKNPNEVWIFLLFTGYLKASYYHYRADKSEFVAGLAIPNLEVNYLYERIIKSWLDESANYEQDRLLKSLIEGDVETFQILFQKYVLNSLSLFDLADKEPERIYHAFVLGLLIVLNRDYEIKSNRESGYGRYDVMLIPRDPQKMAVIIEFKRVFPEKGDTLESSALSALEQIEAKLYKQELLQRGICRHLTLGISFEGKKVLVKSS